VALGLYPFFTYPAIIALSIWGGVLYLTRYMSLASIAGAVALPLVYLIMGLSLAWPVFGRQLPLLFFSSLVAVMILARHRGNIARLRAGTEPVFRRKTESAPEVSRV
jgi:glycerol-3-phosphate acyltransferase PlsY